MSEEEKTLSPLKIKASQKCGNNEEVEEEQREIEVRLNQIKQNVIMVKNGWI